MTFPKLKHIDAYTNLIIINNNNIHSYYNFYGITYN